MKKKTIWRFDYRRGKGYTRGLVAEVTSKGHVCIKSVKHYDNNENPEEETQQCPKCKQSIPRAWFSKIRDALEGVALPNRIIDIEGKVVDNWVPRKKYEDLKIKVEIARDALEMKNETIRDLVQRVNAFADMVENGEMVVEHKKLAKKMREGLPKV